MSGPTTASMGSIETAGHDILINYCDKYPDTTFSHILPPYSLSNHPEARSGSGMQANPRRLTLRDKRQLKGIETRQWGEMGEHIVFEAFHKLSCESQVYPLLSLINVLLDTDNPRQSKEMELRRELPSFPSTVKMDTELDMVIFVKNLGVVGVEVKSSASGMALSKAEDQLDNGREFFSSLLVTIVGSTVAFLPYARVICVPHDNTPSPIGKTANNSHVLHYDVVSNIKSRWNDIVNELLAQRTSSSFTPGSFKRFTYFSVGLWSSIPTPLGLIFDRYKGSLVKGVQEADQRVDTAMIASDYKPVTKPLTNVKYNKPSETPRQCKEIELVYLTMEQKVLYHTHCEVIVRGVAGSGKSILILIKIIHLRRSGDKRNILLLAPFPFILKCEQILKANGMTAIILKTFPGKSSTPSVHPAVDVVIMDLSDFFGVTKEVLDDYDMSSYHLFSDDTQTYYIDSFSPNARYTDILLFFEARYHNAVRNNLYLWICVDLMQSMYCNFDDCDITSMLYVDKTTPRNINIPIYNLTQILRNTKEIIQLVKYTRDERIKSKSLSSCTNTIADGHNITCTPIVYHKLKKGTNTSHKDGFHLLMLEKELTKLLGMVPAFQPSEVAILTEGGGDSMDLHKLVGALFSCSTQTIEDRIKNNNSNDIVFDNMCNTSSFEFPCVVYLRTNSPNSVCQLYNMFTRARSKLVVIDSNVRYPPMSSPNVHLTTWNVDAKGEFLQM